MHAIKQLIKPIKMLSLALGLSILCINPLLAQEMAEDSVDILPAKALSNTDIVIDENAPTHAMLRLTPDKSEIIKLDAKAATIIVGNPNHLSIMADSAERLVLVPRLPGATYFTVLNNDGNVVMQRHVIVASPKEKYMRIRRSCKGSESDACQTTAVYYCPDMCHEIVTDTKTEASPASADSAAPPQDLGDLTTPPDPLDLEAEVE